MGKIFGAFKDPLSAILDAAGKIIGDFVESPDKKVEAQLQLAQLAQQATLKLAEIDAEWAKTQSEVITAEVKSESWMARNWRPILMLAFTYIIVHTYVFVPLFSMKAVAIPDQMWELLKLGIGGYVIGRSAEKTLPDVITAIKGGK